ncbi:MAG TPA: NrsF family protein [Polyangiaceae bacterium]
MANISNDQRLSSRACDHGSFTGPSAVLRSQVLDQVSRERAPNRAEVSRRVRMVALLLPLAPLCVFLSSGGIRMAPRPEQLVMMTALGAAAVACCAAVIAFGRGRSMLGRPAAWLLGSATLTPLFLLTWKLIVSAQTPGMTDQWVERKGLRCLILSLAIALVPLIGAIWLRRDSDPIHPRLSGAAIGAAIGAATWTGVDLWCPVGYTPHLMLGHALPLVLTIMLGATLGGRVLAIRQTLRNP